MHHPMSNKPLRLWKLLSAAALTALGASASHAGLVHTEGADAGQLLASAQTVTGAGTVDAIRGNTGTRDFADLFALQLTAGTAFSASTQDSTLDWNNFDTVLYLFDAAGGLAATNDDGDFGAQSLLSYLPTLSGLYYLAITGASYTPTLTGGALSGWTSITSEFGDYEIRLQGALAVDPGNGNRLPEPGSLLLAGLGIAAAGAARRRTAR